ncbi:hypothetical protein SKAU_G00029530 [Synaphobranchus kaupii]|uniref:Chemokine interleukin-8-like domain-containing protein n=1 Tax=Synaphobranchus kaupii TaxID=118154 RepID=A0A9Q1GDH7_SYNKA|nr:hypothetical protein SKAU_G00029530 [Synaphobranchus kaupii]
MNGCACSEVTQEPPLYHLIRSVQMTAPQLHCKNFLIILASATCSLTGVGHGCKCTQGKGYPIKTKVSTLEFFRISRQCRRIEITATMEQTYQTFCVSTDTPVIREFIHYINSFHSMDRY